MKTFLKVRRVISIICFFIVAIFAFRFARNTLDFAIMLGIGIIIVIFFIKLLGKGFEEERLMKKTSGSKK